MCPGTSGMTSKAGWMIRLDRSGMPDVVEELRR